jgi:hypothetical protein
MSHTNQIKGLSIESIHQPTDLKFVSTDTGIECTITSPTLKGIFEDAIKKVNEAKIHYAEFNKSIGFNPEGYQHDHSVADTAGKRALTKLKKQSESSHVFSSLETAISDEWTIKQKITNECFKSIVNHNLTVANNWFMEFSGNGSVINLEEHDEHLTNHYEVTLENCPIDSLAEADKLLKNAGGKGLFMRVEFSHDARQSIRCVKLHDGDTVYYWLDIHSNPYGHSDHEATLQSEMKGFRLMELISEKDILMVSAKLHTMSAVCENIIGIEMSLTQVAMQMVYRRNRFSDFKVVNAFTTK